MVSTFVDVKPVKLLTSQVVERLGVASCELNLTAVGPEVLTLAAVPVWLKIFGAVSEKHLGDFQNVSFKMSFYRSNEGGVEVWTSYAILEVCETEPACLAATASCS
jgi:hypothetical protein